MKNSKVKTARVQSHTSELAKDHSEQARALRLELSEKRYAKFSKICDQIAESDHWLKNEPIPGGLDLFPHEWHLRYADLFYPYASGGPIYIDTPGSQIEIDFCERKLKAYQARGIRYTYVKAHDDAADGLVRLRPARLPKGVQ